MCVFEFIRSCKTLSVAGLEMGGTFGCRETHIQTPGQATEMALLFFNLSWPSQVPPLSNILNLKKP